MSTTFTVGLVVDDLTLDDATLDRLFDALPGVVPAHVAGLTTVAAPVDAATGLAAAHQLADELRRVFPDIVIRRVEQDFVSIPDIAERTGRSRESIRLLVEGKRGPGEFPTPAGVIGSGIRFWAWAAVLDWFSDRLGDDLGERGVTPAEAARFDADLLRQADEVSGVSALPPSQRLADPNFRRSQRRPRRSPEGAPVVVSFRIGDVA